MTPGGTPGPRSPAGAAACTGCSACTASSAQWRCAERDTPRAGSRQNLAPLTGRGAGSLHLPSRLVQSTETTSRSCFYSAVMYCLLTTTLYTHSTVLTTVYPKANGYFAQTVRYSYYESALPLPPSTGHCCDWFCTKCFLFMNFCPGSRLPRGGMNS